MNKTIYDTFKVFPSFWTQLKNRFARDFRAKDQINNLFFSNRIYDYYKHDTYYGTSDEALNRIFTQITFDCAEFSKKEAVHAKIFEKVEKYWEINTSTKERKQTEITNKTTPPKTITSYNEPILSLTDMSQGAFGAHSRADLLKTTQKHTGADTTTITTKQGMKVVDKEGKPKINPNWVEIETQNPAGLARILACFATFEIDLSNYLVRYRKFFYRSYGQEGLVYQDPHTKRHIFKSWEEIEEEEKTDEEKKKAIPTEDPELSFAEWKKKFKEENPTQEPNFQLYTVYRLEKRKSELQKELKKTLEKTTSDATNWQEQRVFCSPEHFTKWYNENCFCCVECNEEVWSKEYKYHPTKNDNKKFCSDKCYHSHYAPLCDICQQKCLGNTYYNNPSNQTGTICSNCQQKKQEKAKEKVELKHQERERERAKLLLFLTKPNLLTK